MTSNMSGGPWMQQEERNPDLQLHQALVSGGDTRSLQVHDAQLVLGS